MDVLLTGGDIGLPGHFTSQHDEGAATLCAEPRPMAKTVFLKKSETSPIFQMTVTHRDNFMVPAQCLAEKTYNRSLVARVAALALETT